MRSSSLACAPPVLRTLLFAIALGAGTAAAGGDASAAESDRRETVAPAACAPSQPGCREVTFFVDNRLGEAVPAWQILGGPGQWSPMPRLQPGMNRIQVLKPFVDLDHPGSYRIYWPNAGRWLIGAFAYVPDGSVHLTLVRQGFEFRGLSQGIDIVLREDSDPGDLSIMMSCSAGGFDCGRGEVRCASEYLDYEGRASGVAGIPVTYGHFRARLTRDELIGNPVSVLAMVGTTIPGGIGFFDQRDTHYFGIWRSDNAALGGILGEGRFSLPEPGFMRGLRTGH